MNKNYLGKLYTHLNMLDIYFDRGLSNVEIKNAEDNFGFIFPTDLREFLQWKLPISKGFPNWRDLDKDDYIMKMLNWPLEGIIFDIEQNNFWLDSWGRKPSNLEEAVEIAIREVKKAPVLIPVYSHRFMPTEPTLPGNPIYSVYQTDIIYYGYDLCEYFHKEFGGPTPLHKPGEPKSIRFWDQIVG